PADLEGGSQLHGIMGPEPALAGLQHGGGEEGRGQFDDAIAPGQMAAEVAEDGSGLGGGKVAFMLPAGDRGEDFDGGDAGDINPVIGLGTHQGADPGATDLVDMP